MTRIGLLGFGKVGQKVLETVHSDPVFNSKFEIKAIWNRSVDKVHNHPLSNNISICETLEDFVNNLDTIDLVVECAHPEVILLSGLNILKKSHLFLSSPSVLGHSRFNTSIRELLADNPFNCYLPIGASVGIWDIIKLDQGNHIKNLSVTMSKHPDSFKILDPEIKSKLELARNSVQPIEIIQSTIEEINLVAPQNTNTMTIYDLAAGKSEGIYKIGRLVADKSLQVHLVEIELETHGGLQLKLHRTNPASHGAVTGSATFYSFLNSLLNYEDGITHNSFTFC